MTEQELITARLRGALPTLRQCRPIHSLALFGSVVRGEARGDSDLEVLVGFDRAIDLFAFLELEDELGRLTGRRIDLVSRAALKPYMGRRILAETVLL